MSAPGQVDVERSRVLVVATEPVLLAGLVHELRGFDVLEASSAADAISLIERVPPFSAVVTLLLLGSRDGFEVLATANRRASATRKVLVANSVVRSLEHQIVLVSVADRVVFMPWEPGEIRQAALRCDDDGRAEGAPARRDPLRS